VSLIDYIGRYWAGAEIIYGVIIAMTFTSVLRQSPEVLSIVMHRIALTALGCCIAWGIVDGVFYSWERGYLLSQENRIRELSKSEGQKKSAIPLIAEQLDDTILRTIPGDQRLNLYRHLVGYLSRVDVREKMTLRDSLAIVGGTLLRSAGAGLVVVTPFFLMDDARAALWVSNLLGILILFAVGYIRATDRRPLPRLIYGFGTSLLGIIIVGITVILGG
jgi:VIT1/CCC1 family predicted Fe2+/Mn2+ transporter